MKKITTFIRTILMVTAILFIANCTKAVVTMEYDGTTYLCDMVSEGNNIYVENCIGIIGEVEVTATNGGGSENTGEVGSWTPVSEPNYPTGSGGGGGGGTTTNSNSADKPDIDNEICSKQFSSLGCIVDVQSKFEQKTLQTWSLSILAGSFYLVLNWDGLGLEEITDGISPEKYYFKVEMDYKMGSLYEWSGNVFYDCILKRIIRTENGNHNLKINWALVGCNSDKITIYRIDRISGIKTLILARSGGYSGTCIPLSLIKRDGLPAKGEPLSKPYNQ